MSEFVEYFVRRNKAHRDGLQWEVVKDTEEESISDDSLVVLERYATESEACVRCAEVALGDPRTPTGYVADLQARLTAAERERDAERARADAAERDTERLDWIGRNLFERHWNGVVGKGSQHLWSMAGPYRHTLRDMTSETADFRAAIDTARAHLARKENPHD